MRGIVKIGSNDVGMFANAASPRLYRLVFHKDFLLECQKEVVNTDIISEMGFIMAMQDVKTSAECAKLTENDFLEWLEQFDPIDTIEATDAIFELWQKQGKNTSIPKSAGA